MDSDKKYLALKKKLDALHYTQPLGVDSVTLVDRILNDLIRTTEGFQKLKKMNESYQTDLSKVNLNPLKKENQRLTKENNELH